MTPTAASASDGLTPVQQRVLDELRRSSEPVTFDPDDIEALVADARDALTERAGRVGDDQIVLTKHQIAGVLGCETFHLHRQSEPFEWSIRVARGSVAHRAIELTMNWRGVPEPADVVDEAMARLAEEENGLGEWLGGLSPADEADLRGSATESVIRFVESFPPLEKRWRPIVEASARWPVAGPIQMRGKVDLVIGPPRGNESTKVLLDLKTGGVAEAHRQDLRFYALVETLVRRTPPRKLASFYLEAGEPIVEDVTLPLLRSALRRTLDALDRLIELQIDKEQPTTSPGWQCRWCPLAESCDDGRGWLRDQDEREWSP